MSAKAYQVWCRNGGKDHAWYKYKPKNNQRGRKKEKKEKEKEKKSDEKTFLRPSAPVETKEYSITVQQGATVNLY